MKISPQDLPGDPPGTMKLTPGVTGVTSTSIARRIRDSRFATRYFKGFGIDIGPGKDSIALYTEFFPLIRNVVTYDQEQGDAQLLANVNDSDFDFLYSSHCLEHLRDPVEALDNWIRVIKPGGFLVVQVPDEDLYEQQIWPSRWNSDHKITFTIHKEQSWSPVSVNVLDLLRQFSKRVHILHISLEDAGFRYSLQGKLIAQTLFPMAEAGIEFILQKR
ncbi:MAG: class I SAM-dependent methyltransferase [Gammaproteobacteria bacterium]|nr:class I SAM-dependent methyltransferase [Gammaproteobacteria bacterium]